MKTFAVIGLGRFGMAVATQLFRMGYEVLAVDKSIDPVNNAAGSVTRAVCGDAKEESVLKTLGIKNYDCVVVAIGGDITDSVLITLMLKEMGVDRVVCKAMDERHKKVLQKIGADNVIIPEREAGVKTAVSLVSSHIMDIINLSDEYGISDIAVPDNWVGRSLGELSVRRRYGINIVAVKNRLNDDINVAPEPDYVFGERDMIVIVGQIDKINKLSRG